MNNKINHPSELPADISASKVLTSADKEKLALGVVLPDETDVNEFKLIELSELFMEFEDDKETLETKLHELAQQFLAQNKINEAWKTLLAFNN